MKLYQYLYSQLIKKTEEAEEQIIPYGILGVLGFTFFYVINGFILTGSVKEEIYFRMIAGFFSLTLIFKNYWPPLLKKFLPIYWNMVLIFNIPFFFTFILLSKPYDHIWPIHWVLALTLLILLVDLISFLILSSIGIILALAYCFYSETFLYLPDSFGALIAAYVSFTLYYIFIFKIRHSSQTKRINSLKMQAAAIAHEMRSPLGSIAIIASTLKEDLPTLLTFYRQNSAQEKNKLDEDQLENIEVAPSDINTINRGAFALIDMMLMNLKQDFSEVPTAICSIRNCLDSALKEYPFNDRDRELIKELPEKDFKFKGNDLFMKYLFFNLFKNSIYYVRAARKGDIRITSTIDEGVNKLSFKDTGTGISAKDIPHIFDKFYSKTKYGTGVGLAFCKMVMENLGGTITCNSKEGEYTEFVLSFPKLGKN